MFLIAVCYQIKSALGKQRLPAKVNSAFTGAYIFLIGRNIGIDIDYL